MEVFGRSGQCVFFQQKAAIRKIDLGVLKKPSPHTEIDGDWLGVPAINIYIVVIWFATMYQWQAQHWNWHP